MATITQIDSFHEFAVARVNNGGTNLSMDELYEQWRLENLPADELAESVAAVRAALGEMQDDEAWIDAEDHLAQLRSKYGFSEQL